MSSSDWISLGALLVAIFIGVANYVYTKRMFRSQVHPAVQMQLMVSPAVASKKWNKLRVSIKNLSNSIAMTDISTYVYLAKPRLSWKFWPKKWHFYYMEIFGEDATLPSLAPGRAYAVDDSTDGIEYFIATRLPSTVPSLKPILDHVNTDDLLVRVIRGYDHAVYNSLRAHQWLVLVKLMYKPGVAEAKQIQLSKTYSLLPKWDENEKEVYWELSKPA